MVDLTVERIVCVCVCVWRYVGVRPGAELAETGPPGGVRTESHETAHQTEASGAAPLGPR